MEKNNEDLVLNPVGIYINRNGEIFDLEYKEITPLEDKSGYLFIPDSLMPNLTKPSSKIMNKAGEWIEGKYVHRLVVFSFGDKNGLKYGVNRRKSVIDHIDMNHKNNSVENLEQVSEGINLFRAWYKTQSGPCRIRFNDYYEKLPSLEKKAFDAEMAADLARNNY